MNSRGRVRMARAGLSYEKREPLGYTIIHEKFVCSSVERFNTAGPMT